VIVNVLLVLFGAALFGFGLFLIWPPLVMLAGGVSLCALGLTREVSDHGQTD
jgi:hypothetical protein